MSNSGIDKISLQNIQKEMIFKEKTNLFADIKFTRSLRFANVCWENEADIPFELPDLKHKKFVVIGLWRYQDG